MYARPDRSPSSRLLSEQLFEVSMALHCSPLCYVLHRDDITFLLRCVCTERQTSVQDADRVRSSSLTVPASCNLEMFGMLCSSFRLYLVIVLQGDAIGRIDEKVAREKAIRAEHDHSVVGRLVEPGLEWKHARTLDRIASDGGLVHLDPGLRVVYDILILGNVRLACFAG